MTSEEDLGGGVGGSTGKFLVRARLDPGISRELYRLTDQLSGREDVQRILDYAESVAKESRKALTLEFNQKHKGIPFQSAAQILKESLLAWFGKRDKNLKVTYESSSTTKLGELRTVFLGESKRVRFRVHADATFAVAGGAPDSPCYLKELNVTIDRRAFSN